MTKKNNTFFDLLTQVSLPAQNQTLLNLEKFWFQDGISNTFAEELKRETIPLKLSVSKAEIAAVQKCAVQAGLAAQHAHETLEVLLDVCGRQPTKIIFSLKVFEHITPRIHIEENTLSLGNDALLEDALAAATLLARFPQLVYTAPPTIETENALKLPQAFRRRIFKNIIAGRKPSLGLQFLDSVKLLDIYLPEVTAGRHLTQNRFHAHDIFTHLLHSLDGALDFNEPVRWSALLHDVGKVPTRVEGENGEASFHSHELYSARMVVPIMKRLAVPIAVGQKVKFLVRNHMFHYTDEWTDKAVRRFVKKIPLEELQDLIALRLADRKGSGKKSAFPRALQNLIQHIDEIIAQEKKLKIKDLAIDGHTLMELGMNPSRAMGDMLKYLFEEVKAERLPNERNLLIEAVKARLATTSTNV